jgi:hypothetical protein
MMDHFLKHWGILLSKRERHVESVAVNGQKSTVSAARIMKCTGCNVQRPFRHILWAIENLPKEELSRSMLPHANWRYQTCCDLRDLNFLSDPSLPDPLELQRAATSDLAMVENSFDADISLPWRDAHSNTSGPLFSFVRVSSAFLLSSAVFAESDSRNVTQLLAAILLHHYWHVTIIF